jgi:hypothetical protein
VDLLAHRRTQADLADLQFVLGLPDLDATEACGYVNFEAPAPSLRLWVREWILAVGGGR